MRQIRLVIAALLVISPALSFAAVIEITLADFDNATVIDFESQALGAISGTDSLFTDVGISSVVATPQGTDTDPYDTRPDSSRALGANSTGLFIADPGTAGAADTNDWVINFDDLIFRFGFGTHDANTLDLVTLLFDGVEVGSISLSPVDSDLNQFYIESTVGFNSISISQPETLPGFGFMLDNLTLEARSVPEPATLAILALGLFGMGLAARRRVKSLN